jgi:predicted nucleotidyltransferase
MATPDTTKPGGIEFYGGYQVYSESGVDLTLLHAQLQRAIEDRWEGNRRALLFIAGFHRPQQHATEEGRSGKGRLPMLDPAALLRQLTEYGVEFVLIGGHAMIAHGSAYVTEDLDVCYQRTPVNIAALVTAFAQLEPYLRGGSAGAHYCFDSQTIQARLNFTLTTDLGDIDLLGEVSGIGNYDMVLAQSTAMEMYGLNVQVLSIDGLIAAKKAAGRTKDKLHLLELEELKKILDAAPDKEQP